MKKFLLLILISLFACSCSDIFNDKNTVSFYSSISSKVGTKAIFGDDDTNDHQMILWEDGDGVRIYSDHATDIENNHYSDYAVTRVGESNGRSKGKLENINDLPLLWSHVYSGPYNFYAVHPISQISDGGIISNTIPNDELLMVAQANVPNIESKINLEFNPAFSAFRFFIKPEKDGIKIKKLWVKSLTGQSLSGNFTANIANIISNSPNVLSISNGSDTANSKETNVNLTNGVSSLFSVYCLPVQVNGVRLFVNFDDNGKDVTKSMILNYTFTASKQYRFLLTLKTDGEFDITSISDGVIELVRCCSSGIKYNYNLITNMDVNSIRAALQVDENLRNDFTEFIMNAASLNSNGKEIRCSIDDGDFNVFPKLESVDLTLSQNNITISLAHTNVKHLRLNHGNEFSIDDNPELEDINIINVDNNNEIPIEISNCPLVTEFNSDGNGNKSAYSFSNMAGLKKINIRNAGSISVDGCESLEEIKSENASNITALYIKNAPVFKTGTLGNVDRNVSVTLINCSNNVPSASIDFKGNGNATNNGKTNSDKVTVTFRDNGNNIRTQF